MKLDAEFAFNHFWKILSLILLLGIVVAPQGVDAFSLSSQPEYSNSLTSEEKDFYEDITSELNQISDKDMAASAAKGATKEEIKELNLSKEDRQATIESLIDSIDTTTTDSKQNLDHINSTVDNNTEYLSSVEKDLREASNFYGNLRTDERRILWDYESTKPLSDKKDEITTDGGTVTHQDYKYVVETSSGTDDSARLQTVMHGAYTAGSIGQWGTAVWANKYPQNDEVMRWGYYQKENGQIENGFGYGVDSTDEFIFLYKNGERERKIYQQDWNRDTLDGDCDSENPSCLTLDVRDGAIYHGDYLWYGSGSLYPKIILANENGKDVPIRVHNLNMDADVTFGETALPVTNEVDNNQSNGENLKLNVGGRQYSLVGGYEVNQRETVHRVDSVSVGTAEYTAVATFRNKQGDKWNSVRSRIEGVHAFPSCRVRYEWRNGIVPSSGTWETPSSRRSGETALEVNTANFNRTGDDDTLDGYGVQGGAMEGGSKNDQTFQKASNELDLRKPIDHPATLFMKSIDDSGGCTVDDISLKMLEEW